MELAQKGKYRQTEFIFGEVFGNEVLIDIDDHGNERYGHYDAGLIIKTSEKQIYVAASDAIDLLNVIKDFLSTRGIEL